MVAVGKVLQNEELLTDDFWPAWIYNQQHKAFIYPNTQKIVHFKLHLDLFANTTYNIYELKLTI